LRIEIETLLNRSLAGAGFNGILVRMEDVTQAKQVVLADSLRHSWQEGDYQRSLQLGGREYRLTLGTNSTYAMHNYSRESWQVLFFGLLMTGMLGALLLSITGERAQIQALVRENTHNSRLCRRCDFDGGTQWLAGFCQCVGLFAVWLRYWTNAATDVRAFIASRRRR
jgi:hypothetical protein